MLCSMRSCIFIALSCGSLALQVEVNPIRKVVGMLQDMQKELEKEASEEGELFEKAMCACETGEKDLKKTIDDQSAAIESLTASIEEQGATKSQVDTELKEHYSTKAQAQQDLEKATAIRTKESERFSHGAAMSKANIGSLDGAIPLLAGGMSGSSFMQEERAPRLRRMLEVTRYLTPTDRDKVLSFLDDGADGRAGQPTAGVAEIVGVLKSLKDEMEKDLDSATTTEKEDALSYGELKAAKQGEITASSEAIISKEKRSGELAVSLATDKGSLDDAKDELALAQTYLTDLTKACGSKAKERDIRKKTRSDEIAAISEAITILNEDDSLEVFKKALPSAALLTQQSKTFDAFVQIPEARRPGLSKALSEVSQLAKKHPSAQYHMLLMALKGEIRSEGAEPDEGGTAAYAGQAATVVTHMVDDMVHVLHDEDVDDEHKKDFCFNETETTNKLSDEKQKLTDSLTAAIEEMKDDIATLAGEIKTVNEEINENDKEVHEATELRQKEHTEFANTFSTLDTARRLIDKAANRLHKFYNPEMMKKKIDKVKDDAVAAAGLAAVQVKKSPAVQRMEATLGEDALVQKKVQLHHRRAAGKVAPPVLPDTPSTYVKKESGGVLGLMNQMKEDLTADMREAELEEQYAAKDYVRIMKEAKETRAQMVKSLNGKMDAKAELQDKMLQAKEKRTLTLKEIQNLQLYMAQLHAECDFLMRNFDVRHDGRVSEESGLEDAKTIVTHDEPASHGEIQAGYDSEHSVKQVEMHFPDHHHVHDISDENPY